MIIVTIEVAVSASRPLNTADTPDFTEILAEQLFENETVEADDITSDYANKFVRITLTSDQEDIEAALSSSMAAVESALESATMQMPFVETKISSIEAKQLTAA